MPIPSLLPFFVLSSKTEAVSKFLLDFAFWIWHHRFRCTLLLTTQINRCIIIKQRLTALPKKLAGDRYLSNLRLISVECSKRGILRIQRKQVINPLGKLVLAQVLHHLLVEGLRDSTNRNPYNIFVFPLQDHWILGSAR